MVDIQIYFSQHGGGKQIVYELRVYGVEGDSYQIGTYARICMIYSNNLLRYAVALGCNIKFENYSFHSNVCTLVCYAVFTQPVDCCIFNRGSIIRTHSSGVIEVYKIFRKDLFDNNCWQPFNALSFNLFSSELQYSRLFYRCLGTIPLLCEIFRLCW